MDHAYFEDMYARSPDPWGFETEWYEQRKYALTVAALPRPRYRRAFEPGCSIGVLTEMLAPRCEQLVASDLIDDVVERARRRVAARSSVEVVQLEIPARWPAGRFDLVVLSEVAYYLDAGELERLLARLHQSLDPGGHVVAVHWTGTTNYPLGGDEVHDRIDRFPLLTLRSEHREEQFRLDVWERR